MTSFADISHHQASVDLAAYQRAGHERVVLKATEGTSFVDSAFTARWRQAGQLGLARVAYHFARAKFDGADEFDHCLSVVQAAGGLGPRDRLCLDVEDTDTPTRAATNARQFGARAAARGVTQGLVYTGRWYGLPNGITAALFPAGWRRLWLSDYGTAADAAVALWPGWTRDQVAARQFTATATVAGVKGPCDYSRLLRDWLGGSAPTEEDDLASNADDIIEAVHNGFQTVIRGDDPDGPAGDTHPDNLGRIRRDIAAGFQAVNARLDAAGIPKAGA